MPEFNAARPEHDRREQSPFVPEDLDEFVDDLFGDTKDADVHFENQETLPYRVAVGESTLKKQELRDKEQLADRIILNASYQIRSKAKSMGWHTETVEDVIAHFTRKMRTKDLDKESTLSAQENTDNLYANMVEEIEKREANNSTTH